VLRPEAAGLEHILVTRVLRSTAERRIDVAAECRNLIPN
jgi:hypothetical protein